MDLFKVEGNLVVPTEHALLVSPYKEIWDRDEDPKKARAKQEFAYIELNCSYKKSNPYKGLPDEKRKEKVGEVVFKDDYVNFVEDKLIKQGFELYERLRLECAPTLQYYLASFHIIVTISTH